MNIIYIKFVHSIEQTLGNFGNLGYNLYNLVYCIHSSNKIVHNICKFKRTDGHGENDNRCHGHPLHDKCIFGTAKEKRNQNRYTVGVYNFLSLNACTTHTSRFFIILFAIIPIEIVSLLLCNDFVNSVHLCICIKILLN